MANDCCSLRCWSYTVAVLTIVGGVFQFFQFSTQSIIAGLIGVALGSMLFYGVRKEKRELILGYLITQAVLLVIALALYIVGLVHLNKAHLNKDQKFHIALVFYISIGCVFVGFLLLIPIFLYWKEVPNRNSQQA